MTAPILLDITRLLFRAHRGAPTGIDRVELAYAEYLMRVRPGEVCFVTIGFLGHVRKLPHGIAKRFLSAIRLFWRGGQIGAWRVRAYAWTIYGIGLFGPTVRQRGLDRPTLLLVSHMRLDRRSRIERALASSGARLTAFVHDLIPIEYPEYVRPNHAARHIERIETVTALATTIIVNSRATSAALAPWLAKAGRSPRVSVAPLGVDVQRLPPVADNDAAPPYFVFVGTIEPRKNHLMLLQVWRRLASELGATAPRLVLIGRRGWENENIVDLLERSPAILALVGEQSDMSDIEMFSLLRGSRAALFPSFAEGYGLPLAEALAIGVPALCAEIPALREIGYDVPEYLDPLDGMGWLEAIQAYAHEPAPRRSAQLTRLSGWTAPTWDDHFRIVFGEPTNDSPRPASSGIDGTAPGRR